MTHQMLKDREPPGISTATAVSPPDEKNGAATEQTSPVILSDVLAAGVGALLSADLNQASIQVSALQVQQQLGVQALAIANASTQKILKLFEG